MNSDNFKGQASYNTDKSLSEILGEMLKNVAKEPENLTHLAASTSNVRKYENNLQQEYSRNNIQLPSNHNSSLTQETIVWGRMYQESSSPTLALKPEVQVKKEDEDELTKMEMILRGYSPQSNSQSVHCGPSHQSSQQVSPVIMVKDEVKHKEAKKDPNCTLQEQRKEYMTKAAVLETKLEKLKLRRLELKGGGLRSPSPDTKLLLKENTKMQLVYQNKLKNINSLIDMLNGIMGDSVKEVTQETQNHGTKLPPKRFNYVFYDSELHWCRVCNIFPTTATDYLNHLHTHDHKTKVSSAYLEAPWHSVASDDSFPTYPLAEDKRMPIKGLQFFVPSTSWYCKLCDHFTGDLHCASAHLKSVTHSRNYSIFVKENPHWEADWLLDRQKAFEDVRLTLSLEEVDSFNIESLSGKENSTQTTKNENRTEKYLSSPTSSDSDTESCRKERVSRKRARSNSHQSDRTNKPQDSFQQLDDNNSIKVPKSISPPLSSKDKYEERRSEDRRRDDRYDRLSILNDRYDQRQSQINDRYVRHNDRQMRHDRYMRHDDRHTSRRDRSSERRRGSSDRKRGKSPERSRRRSSERRQRKSSENKRLGSSERMRGKSSEGSRRESSEKRCEREQREVRSPNREGRERSRVADPKIQHLQKQKTAVVDSTGSTEILTAQVMHPSSVVPTIDHTDNSIPALPAVHANPTHIPIPTSILHPTSIPSSSDGLDMNQVVQMANQILQQQAMNPFGMDPMLGMPNPLGAMPMGRSLLGPPPGLPLGLQPSLMGVPPFLPPYPLRRNMRMPNKRRERSQKNQRIVKPVDMNCPPGEENWVEKKNEDSAN